MLDDLKKSVKKWVKKQRKKSQSSAQKAYKKHTQSEQTRQRKGASSSSYDSVRKKAQPKVTPRGSGSTGRSSGGSTGYNRGGSTRGSSSRGNERRSGAYRARETAGTGVSKAQTSLNKSAEKTYKGRKVGTYTATKAGPVRRDTTVTKAKTSTGTVRNLTERNERKTTTPGKGFNDSLKRAANANKDFDKNAPEWVKKASDKAAKAANIGSYAAKDMAATGMRLAASTLDGPKDRKARDVDYSKSGDSLKAAAGLKKGEKTTYKPAKLKDGERRDSRGNIVRDVKYGEYVGSDGKIKPLKNSKAKNIQKKINDTAGKWEKSAEKDVQEVVKDFSDEKKYTVPNLGPLNKLAGIESTEKQRKAAEDSVKADYRTQWTQDKKSIKKNVDDYFKEEMGKYGLSEDTVLDNGLTVAQYKNQVLEESLNERLTELKEGRKKDLEKTKDVGKLSPKDVAELGVKGGVGLAEFIVPYAGTAGKALKAADTIMAAGKAGKAAKGAKALTEAAEGGAKKLSVDGRKLVRDYATKVANGEKPAKALADLKKQISMSDLKQNVKRELLANAVQDATVGATLDAASAKAQGLEGKDLAKYMGQSALMNVAFGVPMAGIAGRTTKAGKRAIASDIKTTMNAEFKKVGQMPKEKASELLNLVAKQDGGIELTAKESKRLADLQKEQLQSRSGIVQMDSKGKLVVNEGDVTKSVISEPELKEYTKLQAQYNAGVLKSSDAGRLRELDEKIRGAHDAVAYNADVVLKYGGKTEIDRRNLESAVSYFKQTGDKGKLRKAQALLDKDIKAATKRNESLSKALDNMSDRTGIQYRLVSNDEMNTLTGNKLSADGYFIKGEYRIGDDGTPEILINRDSPQAHQTVIGHETGHLIKDSNEEEFKALGEDLRGYAKDIGEFEEFEKRMRKNYPDLKEEALQEEITCELLGRYIFGENSDFINRLSKEKPSIVRRIVEYVKRLTTKVDDSELATKLKNMTDTAEDLIGKVDVEEVKKNVKAGQAKRSQQKIADEHRNEMLSDIEEMYGEKYTNDFNETGFIFPDGRLPRMGMDGMRAEDHNMAVGLYDDIDYATSYSPKTDAIGRFLDEGNIRIMPENGSIEISAKVPPTSEQYSAIRRFLEEHDEARIEFSDSKGKSIDSKAYENGVNPSQVVNDIKRFYSEGKIGGSDLNNFRYSKEKIESVDRKGLDDIRKRLDSITGEYARGLSTESKEYLLKALKENDPDYELREYTYPEGYDAESWKKAYDEAFEKDMESAMDVSPEELLFNPHFELPSKNRDALPKRTEKTLKASSAKELDDNQAGFAIDRLRELADEREAKILEREIYEGSLKDEVVKTSDYNVNVKQNGARYTDERIDAVIKDNAYGDGKSSSYVTSIHPEDFLDLTLPKESRGNWMRNKDVFEVRALNEKELADNPQTPFLAVDFKTGEIVGHEGRHRMLALSENGIENVPVLIKRASSNDELVTSVRETMELTGQDFGKGATNGARVEVDNLIPACKNFEGDIRSAYGGDAKVKFSKEKLEPKDILDSKGNITKAADDAYMYFAKAGNEKAAQKLVNAALEARGYVYDIYHGTDTFGFTEFRLDEMSKADSQNDDFMVFTSSSPEIAGSYTKGEIRKVSEKQTAKYDEDKINELANTLDRYELGQASKLVRKAVKDAENEDFDGLLTLRDDIAENIEDSKNAWGEIYRGDSETPIPDSEIADILKLADEIDRTLELPKSGGIYHGKAKMDKPLIVKADGVAWNAIPGRAFKGQDAGTYTTREVAKYAKENGYDGVIFKDLYDIGKHGVENVENGASDVYVLFKPEQFKSADAITRDDNGEIIPLSQRGTEEKKDIRFSVEKVVTDEHGNTHNNVVRLDTDLFDGVKRKDRPKTLRKFVFDNLAGNKFDAYDNDGNPVSIEFARYEEKHKKDGTKKKRRTVNEIASKTSTRKYSDQLRRAVAQAEEIIEVSQYDKSALDNTHQWLDKNGWEYRTFKMVDRNDNLFECRMSIGKTEDGRNILYDIGEPKKIGRLKASNEGAGPSPISKQNVPKSEPEVKAESETNMAEAFDKARQGKYSKERIDRELPELRRLEKEGKLTESQKTRLDYLETRVAEAETESEAGVRSISDQRTKSETLSAQKEDLERRLSDLNDRIQTTQNKNPRNPRQRNKALARQEQYEQIEKQIAEIDDQLKTSPELRKLERDLRKEQVYHLGPAIKKYGADSKQVKRINERIDALKRDIATQKAREAQPPVKKPKRMTPKTEAPKTEAPKPEAPKPEPDALHKAAKVSVTPVESMSRADLRKELKQLNGGIRFGKTKEHIELRKQRRDEIKAELDRRTEWEIENLRGITDEQMAPDDPGHSIKPNEEIRKPAEPTQKVNKVAIENIAKEIPRTRQPEWIRSARRLVVNSLAGFEDHAKIIGDNKMLTQVNHVQHWTNKFAAWIEGNRSGMDRKVSGEGLNTIFDKANLFGKKGLEKRNDFVNYLTYKHAIDRLKYDKPVHADPDSGMSLYSEKDYRDMMAEIERKYTESGEIKQLEQFEKDIRAYYDDVMKMRVDSGLVSKEFAEELQKKYPNYIPTLREGDEWLQNGSKEGSRQEFAVDESIKTAKGGSEDILDLYQSTMRITRDVIRDAEQNELISQYAKSIGVDVTKVSKEAQAELPNFAAYASKTEKGWRVSFFQNGEMVRMNVDKQIARGLREINGQEYKRLMYLASKMSTPMRAFKAPITDYNVIFGVRNGARDIQQAAVNSKSLRHFTASIPTAQASILRKNIPGQTTDPWMKSYEANGGMYSTFARQDTEFGKKYVEPKSGGAVKKGLDATAGRALRGLENVNSAIEATPRMAEYIGTIKKDVDAQLRKEGSSLKKFKEDLQKELYGNKELTDAQTEKFSDVYAQRILDMASEETISNAARNAADITLNFSRNGVIGKALNMGFVPYFNPSIQGLSKTVRMFTENGAEGSKALLNFGMKVGVITMAPAAINEILCADNRDYQNLATREKDTNYFIPIGDGKFIKIPKPRENAVMAEPVTYGLRYFLEKASIGEIELPAGIGKDGVIMEGEYSQWKDLGQAFVSAHDNIAPIPISDNLFSPLVRLAQNKTWYGGSIESVGEVLGKKEGELKNSEIYDNTTSAWAIQIGNTEIGGKKISDITHLSPKKIDDLMDSYLGVMYDLGISQTAEVTNGNPIVNQFIKDSVFSNKTGSELWTEFEHANSPKDLKGKAIQKAKDTVLGHSAWNIKEKSIEAKDWLNQKGYDDMTYSSGIQTIREDTSIPEKDKADIIRRVKKAQNEARTDLVYGSKEIHWKKDPLRLFADIVGVDKAMKDYTYTYVDPETGEKKNQHLDAWNAYKKSDEYKDNKGKAGKKWMDFYSKMRWTNGRIGEAKSYPSWMAASVIAATDKGDNTELAKAYIRPISYEDGKSLDTERQADIIQRGVNLQNVLYKQSRYRQSQKTIFQAGRDLGYEYTSEMNPWDKTMALATAGKKYEDTNYYASDTSGKISRRMPYARCLNEKGYSTKQIYDFAKEYDIKLPDTNNMDKDQYVSTMKAFNAKVEAAVKDKYGDRPLEEQAAVYHVITDDYYNKPFGDIGDYGLENDTGITDLDAKSGGGYRRRRRGRRGWRRRGYGGWGGGGGGGSTKVPEKTPSGAYEITAGKVTKAKVTDPFVGNYTKPSNLDDAYRKRAKKLREANSKKLS